MELLTGKAKESFLEWLENQDLAPYKVMFDEVPFIVQASYIIEWLDTVGIYANAIRYNGKFKPLADYELQEKYNTRQEATAESIKKANEIYNKKHD